MTSALLQRLRRSGVARHGWHVALVVLAITGIVAMVALSRDAATSLAALSRSPIDNHTWAAIQTQLEHERFQSLARLARTGSTEVSREEFVERFEILVSRHTFLSKGKVRLALQRLPGFETFLGELALVMAAVENEIEAIDERPLATTAAAIMPLIAPLDRPLKRLAAEALQATSVVTSQHQLNLATLLNHVTGLFVLFGASVTVVGIAMYRQSRRVQESESQIRDALDKLSEANTAKSRFLANISHELRTPLNAIMGFSEVMQMQLFGPLGRRYSEYAHDIHRSAEHLLALITDVLDMARIDAGGMTIREKRVDLAETCGAAVLFLRDRAAAKSVMLTYAPGPQLEIYADPRALRQVVTNLLGNAIKFTPADGEVTFSWTIALDGALHLTIADTGIGIPAGELARVTEPFHRAGNAIDVSEGGTGLGLAITRSLVELHGGRLELSSRVGEGTVATVVLPKHRLPAAVAPTPMPVRQLVTERAA